MSKDEVISKVYYDVTSGFGSIAKTLQAARKIDPTIRQEDVKEFLDKQEVRQTKKRRGDNSFIPFAPLEEFQFDLADFGAAAAASTSSYRYAFVAIDVFSKKLEVVPITSKKPEECARALDIVVDKLGTPNYAYTDDGGEFKAAFDVRLKELLIEHIVTRTHAAFAERVIRTIREGIQVRLDATKTGKAYWWKMLDLVVKQYNETPHVTTGEPPNDIHKLNILEDKDYITEIRERIAGKAHFNRKYPTINVGDYVKILRKPGKFGEFKIGFVAWTKETYRVNKIEYQEGSPLFFLEGIPDDRNRPYRQHEILKVKGTEKPANIRITGKRSPTISSVMKGSPLTKPIPSPSPSEITQPPQRVRRVRVRGKTPDPTYFSVHPLASMIAA